jgi:hypothetical protein
MSLAFTVVLVRRLGCAAVLGLGACAAALAAGSGVSGTVTVSPGCPGPQRVDQECIRPLGGVRVRLIDLAGQLVDAAQTSTDGAFEIAAPPGRYRVEVVTEGRLPRCPPTTVIVEVGKTTTVRITCDSGMR